MKNYLHDPIFFTAPSGDIKRARRLYKGGGGDGGASERKAKEDKRVAEAVKKVNAIFAVDQFEPEAVDKNKFMQQVQEQGARGVYGSLNPRINKPVEVPEGFELITQAGQRTPLGGLNGIVPTTKRFLFNKKGYEDAVAAASAQAQQKNADAMAGRENLYTKIGDDTTNNALVDLQKDRGITERELGFMLARAGLSGGSRDIDVNRDILDTYQQGVLRAANMGNQASSDARSADDRTRVNLINSIRAGLDEGSAIQQAYEGMRNNAQSASDAASLATLSGFFDTLRQRQMASAYNNGIMDTTQQYKSTPYSSSINGDRGRTSSY